MTRHAIKKPTPKFKTHEEEAKFWDNHSFADYWDDLESAKVKFAKNLSKGITVRLDPKTLDKLRSYAHEKGIGPTTLARMWIIDHLKEQEQHHA